MYTDICFKTKIRVHTKRITVINNKALQLCSVPHENRTDRASVHTLGR